jgi:hypothetical protein
MHGSLIVILFLSFFEEVPLIENYQLFFHFPIVHLPIAHLPILVHFLLGAHFLVVKHYLWILPLVTPAFELQMYSLDPHVTIDMQLSPGE